MGEEESKTGEVGVDLNLEAVRGEDDDRTGAEEIMRVLMLEACFTDSSLDESDEEEKGNKEKQFDRNKLKLEAERRNLCVESRMG
jgi:hypothetical protein